MNFIININNAMINDPSYIPLGFSDLTQDEILLVSLFRSWYQKEQTSDLEENSLLDLIRIDRVVPILSDLCVFFRHFKHLRLVTINEQEILSLTEEDLLRVLGESMEQDVGDP